MMEKFYAWAFAKPSRVRWMMNLYFPFLFSGITVRKLSDDFCYCRVELKDWFLTRNMNRTQFGGSLCAMTDPIFSIMLAGALGHKYHVWDKSMRISFDKPGRGRVYCEFRLTPEHLDEIRAKTANGDKFFPKETLYIKDKHDDVIAEVERELYIRLARQHRPSADDSGSESLDSNHSTTT